jgi:DNA-binding MarR family transcriptional regulator
MPKSLQEELKQARPFASVEVEAYVSLMRTYAVLSQPVNDLFKSFGITQTIYNLMRIIRGGPAEGVPCSIIADRLVTRVPDVTRLVDRAVEASLTPKGAQMLSDLHEPLLQAHNGQMQGLSKAELTTLVDLLARLRASE